MEIHAYLNCQGTSVMVMRQQNFFVKVFGSPKECTINNMEHSLVD